MDLMQRRGLIGSKEPEEELYPIGTDTVTKYIGRNNEGYALLTNNKTIDDNGNYVSANNRAASPAYIPVSRLYRFSKNGYRIYNFTWYTKDFTKISSFNRNDLTTQVLPAPPTKAKWFRFATNGAETNWKIKITRTA